MKYYYGILAVIFFLLAVFSYESSFVLAIISWLSACVCTGLAFRYDTYGKTKKIQEELDLGVDKNNVSD